jgi:hypothetical protein
MLCSHTAAPSKAATPAQAVAAAAPVAAAATSVESKGGPVKKIELMDDREFGDFVISINRGTYHISLRATHYVYCCCYFK